MSAKTGLQDVPPELLQQICENVNQNSPADLVTLLASTPTKDGRLGHLRIIGNDVFSKQNHCAILRWAVQQDPSGPEERARVVRVIRKCLDFVFVYSGTLGQPCCGVQNMLYAAVSLGSVELVKELLQSNGKGQGLDIHARDSCGNTALHRACKTVLGVKTVQTLIDHGADCNRADAWGWPPIYRLKCLPDHEAVKVGFDALRKAGADINFINTNLGCGNLLDHGGWCSRFRLDESVLGSALTNRAFPLVNLLLEQGADVNLGPMTAPWEDPYGDYDMRPLYMLLRSMRSQADHCKSETTSLADIALVRALLDRHARWDCRLVSLLFMAQIDDRKLINSVVKELVSTAERHRVTFGCLRLRAEACPYLNVEANPKTGHRVFPATQLRVFYFLTVHRAYVKIQWVDVEGRKCDCGGGRWRWRH